MFLIYFGSATFDQIKKDTKMKMETMVGVLFCSSRSSLLFLDIEYLA